MDRNRVGWPSPSPAQTLSCNHGKLLPALVTTRTLCSSESFMTQLDQLDRPAAGPAQA
jgi:hypothetical protein